MEYLAECLTKFIIRAGMIDESEYEVYRYGFLTGMEVSVCCLTSLIFAIYLDAVIRLLVFTMIFFPLRAYCGGVHAKQFLTCFVCSNLVIVGALLIPSELFTGKSFLAAEILMLLLTHCMAYKAISYEDEAEKKYFSGMRKITMTIVFLVTIVFILLHRNDLVTVVLYTTFVAFISEGIQLIKTICKDLS